MADSEKLMGQIDSGVFDGMFADLYACDHAGFARQRKRWLGVIGAFEQAFGRSGDLHLFSSPGRTELGGNHTDHQQGCVLAGSVNLDLVAAVRPNRDGCIRLLSEGYQPEEVRLDELRPVPEERNTSRALVRGVASRFSEMGHAVGGFDACVSSNVLNGSGLSSSAAFEVLVGTIFNHLYCGGRVSSVDIAIIGRHAENVFFGKPCGLMDQVACATGGAVFIDFGDLANPIIEPIALDLAAAGHVMCIVDSGADHADMSHIYAEIPAEMSAVAACLGRARLRGTDRDELLRRMREIRAKTGDRAVLRALHFFDENERAMLEAQALRAGNFAEFLRLANASGVSSWTYLQNIVPPGAVCGQEMAVSLALCAELLGGRGACRVHGGGFAGTIQAFVPLDLRDEFVGKVEAWLGAGRCHVLSIRKAGGVLVAS